MKIDFKKACKVFVLLVLLLIVLFFLDWILCYSVDSRIMNARHSLYIARRSVKWYKTNTGNNPLHLISVKEYAKVNSIHDINTMPFYDPDVYKERITSASGSSYEYNELNGKGGFFYDSNAGEVKLNITKPLKEYFCWCCLFAYNREEIPADW